MRITEADIGKKVLVQDSTPQPPARHNRKLAAWRQRNYEGVLTRLGYEWDDSEVMTADVRIPGPSYMVITRSGVSLDRITLAP